jgi:hypothetical protein
LLAHFFRLNLSIPATSGFPFSVRLKLLLHQSLSPNEAFLGFLQAWGFTQDAGGRVEGLVPSLLIRSTHRDRLPLASITER